MKLIHILPLTALLLCHQSKAAGELNSANSDERVKTFAIVFVNSDQQERATATTSKARVLFPDPKNAITARRPERVLPSETHQRSEFRSKIVTPVSSQPAAIPEISEYPNHNR